MNKDIINMIGHSTQKSFTKDGSFLERVKTLIDAGIERYYTDLSGIQTIYYGIDGSIYTEKMPYPNPPLRGEKFSEKDVIEALRAIQRGEIIYPEFLNRIIKAGAVNYTVFILGDQVHYVGVKGEIYIEHFPGKNQDD
jgi:uncharacterized protein YbcV (DUF1398 family)